MQQIGPYNILKKLGSGGFGVVYLAEDTKIPRLVAVKIFKPKKDIVKAFSTSSNEEAYAELRLRFIQESNILASLQSDDHIIDVLDRGEHSDGSPWYAMPYVEKTLTSLLGKDVFDKQSISELNENEKARALPYEQAIDLITQILHGLSTAHAQGLVHRDIKPDNILLSVKNRVRISDFGIAKMPDSKQSTVCLLGMGSRYYMAPEQRESAKHVDKSADVYSLGMLMYRMLTGCIAERRFKDPIELQPKLTKALNEVILIAISENKDKRFPSAKELLDAFDSAKTTIAGINMDINRKEGKSTDDTLTWVGNCTTKIDDQYLPLQNKITELWQAKGEITDKDYKTLDILGALGGLKRRDIVSLVANIKEQLMVSKPAFKMWLNWLGSINLACRGKTNLSYEEYHALLLSGYSVDIGLSNEDIEEQLKTKLEALGCLPKMPTRKAYFIVASLFLLILFIFIYAYYTPSSLLNIEPEPVVIPSTKQESTVANSLNSNLYMAKSFDFDDFEETAGVVKFKMKAISGDHFDMGCNLAAVCKESELPLHLVEIADFYIAETETTWQLYQQCIDSGACSDNEKSGGDNNWGKGDRPVIEVSYDDIHDDFLPWLNKVTKQNYRLPSEAEWEYAARAGDDYYYDWGNEIGLNRANCDGCGSVWDNQKTAPVKRFSANSFGLYDMHGNVWEWVTDCWHESYKGAPSDGRAWLAESCARFVLRGGSWSVKPFWLQSHHRGSDVKTSRSSRKGFRLAMDRKVPSTASSSAIALNLLKQRQDHIESVGKTEFIMKAIKGGQFVMGCLPNRVCPEDENPRHHVTVSDFYLAQTETTWELYQQCIDSGNCRNNDASGGDNGWGKGTRPVIEVSYDDIYDEFLPWLNKKN